MAYVPTGKKRPGRPKKHLKPQQTLGVRVDKALYDDIAKAALEQEMTIQSIVQEALMRALDAPHANVIDNGVLGLGEAFQTLETHCKACPTCAQHVTATLDAAWPAFIAAAEELGKLKGW